MCGCVMHEGSREVSEWKCEVEEGGSRGGEGRKGGGEGSRRLREDVCLCEREG